MQKNIASASDALRPIYRSFYQNLSEKLNPQEIVSLNVLGKDFFTLIDHIVSKILVDRPEDYLLLGIDPEQYLWEIQVFLNQYIRDHAGSVMKLRSFCRDCLDSLQEESYYHQFMKKVYDAYTERFFLCESDAVYLV